MKIIIENSDGVVWIESLPDGLNEITVKMRDPGSFCPLKSCTTSYPIELIRAILATKGPAWLCDEIRRDEDPTSVQSDLKAAIFSYVQPIEFKGKKILDFGCGCGSSIVNIARLLPETKITGIDINPKMLDVARLRNNFYGFKHINLLCSSKPDQLPDQIGNYDFVILSAVFEHLLPVERQPLIDQIWNILTPGGILFINQTPDIRFPIESHTTGLPLINYLPDKLVFFMARNFSKRVAKTQSWEDLLRNGIRGTTPNEVLKFFSHSRFKATLLRPNFEGVFRQSDIWYRASFQRIENKFTGVKGYALQAIIKSLIFSRLPIAPYVSLAIKKNGSSDFVVQ